MWFLIVPAVLVLAWIIRLAINPVETVVNTLRGVLFLIALALFALWFFLSDKQDSGDFEVLWFSLIVASLWLLTFIIPAVVRRR